MKGLKDGNSSSENESSNDNNSVNDSRNDNDMIYFQNKYYNSRDKKLQYTEDYKLRDLHYTKDRNYNNYFSNQHNYQENIYDPYIKNNMMHNQHIPYHNSYNPNLGNFTVPIGYENNITLKNEPKNDILKKSNKRSKHKIEYIEDKNRRNVTFSKRKKGIMKKAYEIATLTGSDILLIVASESGHVYTYASSKLKPFIIESQDRIEAYLRNKDGNVKFDKQF